MIAEPHELTPSDLSPAATHWVTWRESLTDGFHTESGGFRRTFGDVAATSVNVVTDFDRSKPCPECSRTASHGLIVDSRSDLARNALLPLQPVSLVGLGFTQFKRRMQELAVGGADYSPNREYPDMSPSSDQHPDGTALRSPAGLQLATRQRQRRDGIRRWSATP